MAQTTITVQESTLERFKRLKAEADAAEPDLPDVNADHFVNSLLDTWEKVGEEGYGYREDTAREVVSEIRDTLGIEGDAEVAEQVRESTTFPTADVKEAMRAVLREELPEGALR